MKIPGLLLTLAAFTSVLAQESPRTESSLLQPQMEVAAPSGDWLSGDYLTGNWGGYRDQLRESGVEVFGFYNSIFSGNVAGGRDAGHATYVQDAWVGLKFDLEKIVVWTGGQFVVSGINRTGDDLTTEYIGSAYSTQQMVGGQRPFLYQVYLQQKFGDKLTAKLGRFSASDDFNSSPLYGYSLNNGINGNIRNVLFNTRFSAYPFPVWAGALLFNPTPEYFVKLGLFQTSQGMFENDDNGVNFSIKGDDGYTFIAQVGWTPELFKRPVSVTPGDGKNPPVTELKGMPGHYWLGFTYSDWDYYQRFDDTFEDHSYGFYVHADQMIYQEGPGSDQGLTAFVAAGYYPQEEISIIPFQVNVGLNYKGLPPGRKDDRTMIHFIYGNFSSDYADANPAPGSERPESEKVFEAAHRFQITPWSYFQPDVQWVINPGGTSEIDDAIVIGAQMGVTF